MDTAHHTVSVRVKSVLDCAAGGGDACGTEGCQDEVMEAPAAAAPAPAPAPEAAGDGGGAGVLKPAGNAGQLAVDEPHIPGADRFK
jgi:hypothetical protein